MWMAATPIRLSQHHIATLHTLLPRVVDGDIDGVHDARVVTRRLRELLPLTLEWLGSDAVDGLTTRFRRIGRALGTVRDADVRLTMLEYLEARVPNAAPSLIIVRQACERDRLTRLRRMIKRLERLEVGHSLEEAVETLSAPRLSFIGRAWRRQLGRTVGDRARDAHESIEHATGVFFPNRLHRARIALKKLRYAAEIVALTGRDGLRDAVRDLRKAQDILGDVRDRQLLIEQLPKWVTPDWPQVDAGHVRLATQVMDAECHELHARYLARRSRLVEICDHAHRPLDGRRMAAAAPKVAAGAIALTSAVYAWHRLREQEPQPGGSSRVLSVRIPIDVPSTAPGK